MKSQVEIDPAAPGATSAVAPMRGELVTNGALRLHAGGPRPHVLPAPANPDAAGQWGQLLSAAARHWAWVVLLGLAAAVAGVALGRHLWPATFRATAQIVRHDTPDPQLFQPRPVNSATLVGIVDSAEMRSRVGAGLTPALTADELARRVQVAPVPSSDLVNITVSAPDAATAAAQANRYAEEAVRFTQEMQGNDARDAASYLRRQLTGVEAELTKVNQDYEKVAGAGAIAPAAAGAATLTPLQTRLSDARLELSDLQARYTDQHPLVQMQLARVAAMEKQLAAVAPATNLASPVGMSMAEASGRMGLLMEKSRSLEAERRTVANRLQITELLAQHPIGEVRVFSAAKPERATANNTGLKIGLLAVFLGLCGAGIGVVGAVTDEAFDQKLRTPDDIRRVTQLPVLARVDRLDKLSAEEKARWGFRTWTTLQSRLSVTPNQGLVCGFTSSTAGEGRSAWIKLVADAASKCGFRVAVITTRAPGQDAADSRGSAAGRPAAAASVASTRFRTAAGEPKSADPVLVRETLLSGELLNNPDEAVEKMLSSDGASVVHIPLPGWVWGLEHRKAWLASLTSWSRHENVVILVDLPPASEPETVLLAQNLPNVVWLSDCTRADALRTRQQIETLRQARCNLIGAVANHSSAPALNERFARWAPAPALAAVLLAAVALPAPARAQAAVASPESFSIVSPEQRADWQRHLTLGPGDVLSVAVYGEPATRAEITVQPDGRISFLEARDVVANGLTIDELRGKLDDELGRYRRAARTMISPVAFRSKKYYMLGLIAQRGAFTLDRPMTVVEAVARARGFATSAASGDVTEMADLQHAFLVRDGKRQDINFQRLFASGDLSQNIPVEPNDYFYFPPASMNQVYVLGEVRAPGPAVVGDQATSLRAIASRGGFTDRAWRDQVLIVRGSLNDPKPIQVNLAAVLRGEAADVTLEPQDIIYVSSHPFWKVGELLNEAARAFTQALVVYWTSDHVIPVVPLPTK